MTPEQYVEINNKLELKHRNLSKELHSLQKMRKHLVIKERMCRKKGQIQQHAHVCDIIVDANDEVDTITKALITNHKQMKKLNMQYAHLVKELSQ